jgi:hypothetical protein
MNSQWLESPNAPKFVLQTQPKTIDSRITQWNSPKFQFDLLCKYKEILADQYWVLLEKRPQQRCQRIKSIPLNAQFDSIKKRYILNLPLYEDGITTLDLRIKEGNFRKFARLFFKPIPTTKFYADGNWKLFPYEYQKSLIVRLDPQLNYSNSFALSNFNTLEFTSPVDASLDVYRVQ